MAVEHIVSSDPAPNHMGFPLDVLLSVLEGRTTIIRPRHLEDSLRAPNALDAKPFSEGSLSLQIPNKLFDG